MRFYHLQLLSLESPPQEWMRVTQSRWKNRRWPFFTTDTNTVLVCIYMILRVVIEYTCLTCVFPENPVCCSKLLIWNHWNTTQKVASWWTWSTGWSKVGLWNQQRPFCPFHSLGWDWRNGHVPTHPSSKQGGRHERLLQSLQGISTEFLCGLPVNVFTCERKLFRVKQEGARYLESPKGLMIILHFVITHGCVFI